MINIKRQDLILSKIIQEYIDFAIPISSKRLEEKYNFGVSPATIRNEMQRLTGLGFLFQPHTSAGRIPTDKAYRFLVDKILLKQKLFEKKQDFGIKDLSDDPLKFIQSITRALAATSSNLAVSYLFNERFLWKEGWEELLQAPEFQKTSRVSDFVKFLKSFERDIEKVRPDSNVRVYIGRETPFTKSAEFSLIISKCCFPDKEEGVISILGPKRMAYNKNIALINSLKRILENF
jgi:heat-inducible transcriptional repressor